MHRSTPLRPIFRRGALVLGLLSATLLGGCVKFGGKPPATLLTIGSANPPQAGAQPTEANGVVTIIEPDAPKSLQTVRVAVRTDANDFAYVPKAVWVDTPRNMFKGVLSETVAARNGVLVLDSGQFSTTPGRRLTGDLMEFGIDARSRQAVVTFEAVLYDKSGAITKHRFTATAPVRSIDQRGVAAPIQDAANAVAVQVADWLKAGGGDMQVMHPPGQ